MGQMDSKMSSYWCKNFGKPGIQAQLLNHWLLFQGLHVLTEYTERIFVNLPTYRCVSLALLRSGDAAVGKPHMLLVFSEF